jgi:uncharacterized protein (DUF58 family)
MSPRTAAPDTRTSSLFDKQFIKQLEYLYLITSRVFKGTLQAKRRSQKSGTSPEFMDYRAYTVGDDIKFIDWYLYARLESLMIKLFEEEEDLNVYFVIDSSRSMSFGRKFPFALQVGAALSYIALRNFDRVAFLACNADRYRYHPLTRGKGKFFSILEFLETLTCDGETDFERAVQQLRGVGKKPGIVVWLSDFFDADHYQHAIKNLLFLKHDIICFQTLAREDVRPDLLGETLLTDAESGAEYKTIIRRADLERYRAVFSSFMDDLEQFCKRMEIRFLSSSDDVNFVDVVLKLFRRGGFVK